MKAIEYKGKSYRPSQFWPLVRVLQQEGHMLRIDCHVDSGGYTIDSTYGPFFSKSPFLSLAELVADIKKAEGSTKEYKTGI
jgi:hypothetical protein